MKLSAYVIFLFGISLMMYLTGSQSMLLAVWGNMHPLTDNQNHLDQSKMWNAIFIGGTAILGSAVIAILAGWALNFGSLYIVALILLFGFMNIVVFPLNDILTDAPDIVKIPMFLFFNILFALMIYDEGRGR